MTDRLARCMEKAEQRKAERQRVRQNATERARARRREKIFEPPDDDMPLSAPVEDTRSITGQVFGDPMPGRSALDRRRL